MSVDSVNYTGLYQTGYQNNPAQNHTQYINKNGLNRMEKDEFSTGAKAAATTAGIIATGYLLTHGHANKWFEGENIIKRAIDKPAKWLSENIAVPLKEKAGSKLTEVELKGLLEKTTKKLDNVTARHTAAKENLGNLYKDATPEQQNLLIKLQNTEMSVNNLSSLVKLKAQNVSDKQTALNNLAKDAAQDVKDAAQQELSKAQEDLLTAQFLKAKGDLKLKDAEQQLLKADDSASKIKSSDLLKANQQVSKLQTEKIAIEDKIANIENLLNPNSKALTVVNNSAVAVK